MPYSDRKKTRRHHSARTESRNACFHGHLLAQWKKRETARLAAMIHQSILVRGGLA